MTQEEYAEYRKSDHWRRVRTRKLTDHPFCRACNFPYELNVHHLTYENLGAENDQDLEVLCRSCHSRIHFIEALNGSEYLKAMIGVDPEHVRKRLEQAAKEARKRNLERSDEIALLPEEDDA